MLQQAYTPSNTGIASFVHASADYDLAPIGIGSMQEQADRLAEFGRNGDIYVVHAAEGETVIPMEVLDSNPQIKEMLFAQMRDMGMDPERYVVGNELNSINPDTGIPEFFFSSVWKSVKKVFKKAAPIIASLVGNAILPGIGGILASTLVAGYQSGWDLKSMAVAGVTGYAANVLTGGIGGLMNNTGFMAGATQAASAPWNALNDLSGSYAQGAFGTAGAGNAPGASWYDKTLGRTYDPNAVSSPQVTTTTLPGSTSSGTSGISAPLKPVDFIQPTAAQDSAFLAAGGDGDFLMPVSTADSGALTEGLTTLEQYGKLSPTQIKEMAYASLNPASSAAAVPVANPSPVAKPSLLEETFGDTGKTVDRWMFGGGKTPQNILDETIKAENDYIALYRPGGRLSGMKPTEAGLAAARADAAPSIYAKYGPSLALAGTAAYLGGAFDETEEEETEEERDARQRLNIARGPNQLFAADRSKYRVGGGDPNAIDPYRFQVASSEGPVSYTPFQVAYQTPQPVNFGPRPYPTSAANGGFIDGQPQYLNDGGTAQYPRREMLVEGPGTERSDDIPAMLSDGEFVLNSRSVRGADPTGQGNRYRGAQNLYNMMRNFEMRG